MNSWLLIDLSCHCPHLHHLLHSQKLTPHHYNSIKYKFKIEGKSLDWGEIKIGVKLILTTTKNKEKAKIIIKNRGYLHLFLLSHLSLTTISVASSSYRCRYLHRFLLLPPTHSTTAPAVVGWGVGGGSVVDRFVVDDGGNEDGWWGRRVDEEMKRGESSERQNVSANDALITHTNQKLTKFFVFRVYRLNRLKTD